MRKDLIGLICYVGLAGLLGALFSACGDAAYADEREVQLTFSADTLSFDTLFTTVGSTTRRLTVYNRSGSDVRLGGVSLAGGRASRFRLNVDGDTSLVARNVELLDGDSLFIFVQANISPNDAASPFLVEDAILFSNGQRLPLTAWGRNAVYHTVPAGAPYSVVDCEQWDHSRPHVILGTAAVLDGHTLALQAGDELYFHDGAILAFDTNARLVAHGSADRPVLFTSMRHDGWYDSLPGQWQCLWFTSGSDGNVIDHAIVENGTGGLRVYPNADLTVSNTVVRSMSDCAFIGQGGSIAGSNLLVYDCFASFTVLRGGSYSFTGCTFADYWRYSARSLPSVVLTNYLLNADGSVREAADLLRADFTDCIVYGNRSDGEFMADGIEGYLLNYRFENSIVKGGEWDEDPLFADTRSHDFHLQDSSPAVGIGYQYDN